MSSSPDGVIEKFREENERNEKIDEYFERIKGKLKDLIKKESEKDDFDKEEFEKDIEDMFEYLEALLDGEINSPDDDS